MQFLNKEYKRKGSSLIILYGRRRVGKTELSSVFMKDKNALYFLVTEEDICVEEMWKLNAEDKWNFTFDKVGRWWKNYTEIDIVALDSTWRFKSDKPI